ncbi:GNAT family N-acetyltransferase [Hydrogenophaga sp. 5NK40-0174]|uniref:GNAT family N-acetyltransferase n=1 Tax=Hydrogenophaga sp. 5NK40-0174 TaxID=3127649 RepID=UPI003106DC90
MSGPVADISVRAVNYRDAGDALALVALLDAYARDPAGGGEGLSDEVKTKLAGALAVRPEAFSVMAFAGDDPVGLINCFEGFSTFACAPLVNVHDVVVVPGWRGKRIAERMLEAVEQMARERGACKLTLEVLSLNTPAKRLYERVGFAGYALDPAKGVAEFMQKWLR